MGSWVAQAAQPNRVDATRSGPTNPSASFAPVSGSSLSEVEMLQTQFWKIADMMWKWVLFLFSTVLAVAIFAYGDGNWVGTRNEETRALAMAALSFVVGLHYIGCRFMVRACRVVLDRVDRTRPERRSRCKPQWAPLATL